VLRRIFGPKRDEELHNLYSSPIIIRLIKSRRMRWAGHVAQMGEKRDAYIKMDLREIGRDEVDWIDMAQDRDQWRALVNTVLKLRVP
jgi:hypothetical protein